MAEFPGGCLLSEFVAFRREDERPGRLRTESNSFAWLHFRPDPFQARSEGDRDARLPRPRRSKPAV